MLCVAPHTLPLIKRARQICDIENVTNLVCVQERARGSHTCMAPCRSDRVSQRQRGSGSRDLCTHLRPVDDAEFFQQKVAADKAYKAKNQAVREGAGLFADLLSRRASHPGSTIDGKEDGKKHKMIFLQWTARHSYRQDILISVP